MRETSLPSQEVSEHDEGGMEHLWLYKEGNLEECKKEEGPIYFFDANYDGILFKGSPDDAESFLKDGCNPVWVKGFDEGVVSDDEINNPKAIGLDDEEDRVWSFRDLSKKEENSRPDC